MTGTGRNLSVETLRGIALRGAIIALTIAGIAVLNLHWFHWDMHMYLYRSLLPLWLIPTLFVLFRYARPIRPFVFLGTYAYTIYLYHGFGTSGGRIIMNMAGVHDKTVIFGFALLIALLLPVAADRIFSKNRLTAALLLGKQIKKR